MPVESLNMDRSKRVVLETTSMPWEASPAAGVMRKKLEREAAESGQVTSVVRYEAGSRFKPHLHPAGEEILVLDGIFEDEHGAYPAGSYLRNPPGSSHAPGSTPGCVLLVKLNMIARDDAVTLRKDTGGERWLPGQLDGLWLKPLHAHRDEQTRLVRFDAGASASHHEHPRGEEIFVLEGVLEDDFGCYSAGTWLRAPPGSAHRPTSSGGCTVWVKSGHIDPIP